MKLSTRKTMALGFSGAYVILTIVCTLKGIEVPHQFSVLVSGIVSFYFGGETALKIPGGKKDE